MEHPCKKQNFLNEQNWLDLTVVEDRFGFKSDLLSISHVLSDFLEKGKGGENITRTWSHFNQMSA